MASKMAQDSSRWLNIASDTHPRGPKTAPRRIQVPFEPSTILSKMSKSFKSLGKINVLVILAFSLPMGFGILKMAPSWPKRAPRGAQDGPAHKSAPKAAQEGPKTPFGSLRGGGPENRTPPLFEPRGQDGPKRPPRSAPEIPPALWA